jgi:hypothetical protein
VHPALTEQPSTSVYCPSVFRMENGMIFVVFAIDDEILVLWQNIGTLHQHFELNEDALSNALSAAETED